MANQHPGYSHPGPSSYYSHTPPPPPHHHPLAYAPNHNAVPFYPPYPPPMNGQLPASPSPRMSGPPRGGYMPHRGHNYSHYHHPIPPQHHYMSPQPITPTNVSPTIPYHPQKYSPHAPPFSPSYPHQHNNPYHPQWHVPPISPLPKQLSTPLPPQSHAQEVQMHPPPSFAPAPMPQNHAPPPAPVAPSEPSPSPSVSQLPSDPSPPAPPSPQVQVEFISDESTSPKAPSEPAAVETVEEDAVSEEPSSSILAAASSTGSTSDLELVSGWVIWSRRGSPSSSPGVIISPRANPPEHVVQKALQLPSPPPSPKIRPKVILTEPPPQMEVVEEVTKDESPEPADVPSSSATESTPACSTAPDTPVPGSPISSNTSISVTAGSPITGKPIKPLISSEVKGDLSPTEAPPVTMPPAPEPSTSGSTVTESVSQAETTQPTEAASTTATPQAPPKVIKSWASLLRTSDNASSSRSGLPTSNVVGFSIPAASTSSGSSSNGAPVQARPELLNLLTTGPTGSMPPPKLRPRGIINTGNMCFANSVLQVLPYCPPFYRFFTELGKYISGPVVGSQKDGTKATPLVEASIQFLKEFNPKGLESNGKGKEREEDDFYDLDSFIPTYVYDVMKEKKRFASMVGGYQEDAEEFLGFFLDTLEEELATLQASLSPKPKAPAAEPAEEQDSGWHEVGKRNKAVVTRTIKSADSPITHMFGGKFRTTLRAPHQKDSATVEDWRALRLDISRDEVRTIKDALRLISLPQPVQITSPTRPGQVIEATQHALIESLPPILVLHVKRFMYDTKVGDVVKIGKQVAYGPELEITPDLLTPAQKPHAVKYKLFGVVYHHGQSASGGHYTLDVLHSNRDMNDRPREAWIRIDDELVSDIHAKDVFETQDVNDRCAYLLFYRRMTPTPRTWSSAVASHNAV